MINIITQAIISGVLQAVCGFGTDSITQYLELSARSRRNQSKIVRIKVKNNSSDVRITQEVKKVFGYDIERALRFAKVGGFVIGPLAVVRFAVLDTFFPGQNVFPEVTIKVIINNILCVPIVAGIGLGLNEYLKPKGTISTVRRRLNQELLQMLMVMWTAKLAIQYVVFLGPTAFTQFLLGLVANCFLNIYASWRANVRLLEDVDKSLDLHPHS
eukprot:NODE_7426_length_779_cov_63.448171_g6816_i0.p1 GENE.NODE_7426_length_779_cov_63.448171_g6816_i0~~NODE_7426_length_779_cov_63.448171_g6816_i0.p1  ORF type:complete len:214 (+),score=21.43 NODE_7426_length_779_cov_63.448171_g6816_i0:67-708(+)